MEIYICCMDDFKVRQRSLEVRPLHGLDKTVVYENSTVVKTVDVGILKGEF